MKFKPVSMKTQEKLGIYGAEKPSNIKSNAHVNSRVPPQSGNPMKWDAKHSFHRTDETGGMQYGT